MLRIGLLLSFGLVLTSCSYFHVHKIDVDQGNHLSATSADTIHVGMTRDQVIAALGQPVLGNVFDENRLDYVYTYQPGYGEGHEKYLTVFFRHGIVSEVRKDLDVRLQR